MTDPSRRPMHPDEVPVDEAMVRCLLRTQMPALAELPLAIVEPWGTDNAIWRLGEDLVVRLPRIGWARHQPVRDATWLPRLAPHIRVTIPEPVAVGEPGEGYPFPWARAAVPRRSTRRAPPSPITCTPIRESWRARGPNSRCSAWAAPAGTAPTLQASGEHSAGSSTVPGVVSVCSMIIHSSRSGSYRFCTPKCSTLANRLWSSAST